ncbi:MAG: sigma-54-dependent Fis family transcriptional regulator [Planctomycetes bacterium]|nr:sigma-54-dependent Fis family transcriptional regulator [Planctomycetota bacterium]
MSIQRVLIVDDESLSREFLMEAAQTLGCRADAVPDGAQAVERLKSRSYDLLITDLRMPGMDGLEVIRQAAQVCPGMPAVLLTAFGTIEAAVQAMKLGAADFLLKPCTPETLELVLRRIERTRKIELENEYLRAEVAPRPGSQIVAKSRSMLETLASAQRIAGSKGTVLITGESGTGKERIAHYIHQSSPRREQPFVRVNCAALSEQLLESELFGHERGAFTGAYKSRVGRFELADGGTLLLDEIGEISQNLQAKLLRVLEEEEFERVGGSTTLKVDVRVIATTNRDLQAEVRAGRFREDLYYRLHVLPVHLAPLRERREDVLALAEHFAKEYATSNGRPQPLFAADARRRLEEWSWPGNVRELENAIQRAVVLMQGNAIGAELLPGGAGGAQASGSPSANPFGFSTGTSLANRRIDDIEREAILATLASTGNNKTEAARRLGVTARTLSNKMKLWRRLGLVA